MDEKEIRESIIADITTASETCNSAVEGFKKMIPTSGMETLKAAALIGINQALVAIAEVLMYMKEGGQHNG